MPDSAIPAQQSAQWRTSFRLTQPTVGLEWFYYNVSRENRLLFEYFLDEFEIRLAVLWRRQGSL